MVGLVRRLIIYSVGNRWSVIVITSLRLKNFKNFADETLKLGPFTVIVGANASGKSNIRDAFRFLHGIGRGYTLAEIIGGKVGEGGQTEWDAIRGAPIEIARFEPVYPFAWSKFAFEVGANTEDGDLTYFIEVGFNQTDPHGFQIFAETLKSRAGDVFGTHEEKGTAQTSLIFDDQEFDVMLNAHRPVLLQIDGIGMFATRKNEKVFIRPQVIHQLIGLLGSMRFVELVPDRLREPSATRVTALGPSGQNLAATLEAISSDPERRSVLISWVHELTPMDVVSFNFPLDPNGRVYLRIVERNGREVSAVSASDGTLRFLAMLAVLLNEESQGTYFFEDIDSGIHPSRLRLLLELIETQTAKGKIQVITTTHSPALLAWMNDETFENTSVVYRDEHWSDSVIRPIADLFNLRELRKSKGLEWLLTSDWLDNALHFSEGGSDTEDGEGDAEE